MHTKHSDNVKQQAQQLREQGKTAQEIADELNIPVGTVKKWVYGEAAKEKPASENDTGKEKEVLTADNSVADSIPQPTGKVKYTFSEATIKSMADAISECMDDIAQLCEQVDDAMQHYVKKQAQLEEKQAQLAAMEADYNIICGGEINE